MALTYRDNGDGTVTAPGYNGSDLRIPKSYAEGMGLSPEIADAATAPQPDTREANLGAMGPVDPSVVAGFNDQDSQLRSDAGAGMAHGDIAPGPAAAPGGPSTQELGAMLNAPLPNGGRQGVTTVEHAVPAVNPARLRSALTRGGPAAVGGGPRAGKPQWIDKTESFKGPAYQRTDEDKLDTRVAANTVGQALTNQADVERGQARDEYAIAQRFADQQELQGAEMQKRQAEHQQELQRIENDYAQTAQHVAGMKEDQNRLWNSKTTGQKFATQVGAILLAFQAGLQGRGADEGLRLWEADRDRDLQAQRNAQQNAKAGLEAKRGLLDIVGQRFRNQDAQMLAARAISTENFQNQLTTAAKKYNDPRIDAGLQDTLAKLEAKRVADEQAAKMAEAGERTTQRVNLAAMGGPGPKKPVSTHEYAKFVADQKIPARRAMLDKLERSIDVNKDGDLPGIGPGASKIPDAVYIAGDKLGIKDASRALENRRQITSGLQSYIHEQTGSGSSEQEREGILKAAIGTGRAQDVKNWIREQRKALDTEEANAGAAATPEVRDAYEERGGLQLRGQNSGQRLQTFRPVGNE